VSYGHKLAAIDSICGPAALRFDAGKEEWTIYAPNLKTWQTIEERFRFGKTPEEVITKFWRELTYDMRKDTGGGPAERNSVCVREGKKEVMYRWSGFHWERYFDREWRG
jgi:hypothetical protein